MTTATTRLSSPKSITLSDTVLNTILPKLCEKEREATHAFLTHLIEFDKRALYREQGYSSLFSYLTGKLHYSEGSAQRRILGERCIREHPELGELFLKGRVTLCSIAAAAGSIKREATKVEEIVGKSKREVEAIVAAKEPERAVRRESVRPVAVKRSPLPLFETKAACSPAPISSPVNPGGCFTATTDHAATEPPLEERYEVRFSLCKEEFEALEEAKNLLSNSLGQTLSVAGVLSKLVERYLKPYRRASTLKSSASRYIPASVKHEVYRRDGGECSYTAPDGTKCREKQHLQFDHIQPYSLGGKTEASNLRLSCPSHNRLWAERCFGKFEIKESSPAYGGMHRRRDVFPISASVS